MCCENPKPKKKLENENIRTTHVKSLKHDYY